MVTSQDTPGAPRPWLSARTVVQLALVVLVFPALPLLVSGDLSWREAWAFFAVGALGFVLSRIPVALRNPDLIAERGRGTAHEGVKDFDKFLAPIVALAFVVIAAVAGADRRWNGASPWFPAWSRWAALGVIVATYAFGTWAMVANRFFSGVVRIQRDRGHHVVSSGPYRFVRHPGYAGSTLSYLATPVLLSSTWALVPAVLAVAALVVRTSLEDRTLRAELPGYEDYARRTRYRLLPGIW